MGSQLDLDQGGTARSYNKIWLGPSVGWIWTPVASIFPITAAGTYQILPSTTYITVNVNGVVNILLPTTALNPAGAQAVPNLFAQSAIVITDVGGFANANPITIRPFSIFETIMGLTQIQINSNFGGYTLAPNSAQLTWNSISP